MIKFLISKQILKYEEGGLQDLKPRTLPWPHFSRNSRPLGLTSKEFARRRREEVGPKGYFVIFKRLRLRCLYGLEVKVKYKKLIYIFSNLF